MLAVTNDGFAKKPSVSVTAKNLFQMSRDTNFVILLLDAVDAYTLKNVMETDPEYYDMFTDFTFYDNMLGAYPYTEFAVPCILSGEWYENEEKLRDFEIDAYAQSPFLEKLEEDGYRMAVYSGELPAYDGNLQRFENVLSNERGVNDKWAFIRWQALMMGFRYAPYDLKRFSFVNPNAFNDLKIPPKGEELYSPFNPQFYEAVLGDEISYTEQKCFKFIHILGGHLPFQYDKDVNIIENGTYEGNIQASLTITKEYLNKLKAGGVYDNSVIIVMADHGYNLESGIYGRQNPIFFVKGIEEKHGFVISDAPVSFADLQEAYRRLLNGAASDEIFDWQSGDSRRRRYILYQYLEEDHMVEYMQTGHAHDTDSMYKTGTIYEK